MENKKCGTVNELQIIDDEETTITIKDNFNNPKAKKCKKKVTKTMNYENCEPDNEPPIIIDNQEPIRTKENCKKPKTKKHKRKVKLGKDSHNNTETLYITQKLKVKKSKFSCIININNVGKKRKRRPSSIVRFARNECKREAYYNRIVPICMRNNCFADDLSAINCCRTVGDRYLYTASRESKFSFYKSEHYDCATHMSRCNEDYRIKKADHLFATKKSAGLSPVSSSPLAESLAVSYEDVSDASFSSEDELDTLIKRTKKREHQFAFSAKSPEPLDSIPMVSEDVASTYSGGSLHSTSTLVLPPLETEAYSPTTSPGYMCNVSVSYSPTFTQDLITIENVSEAIERPYSPSDPTNTLVIHEDDNYVDCGVGSVKAGKYSLASPTQVKFEVDYANRNNGQLVDDCMQNGRNVKTEIDETDYMIKIEDIKREDESVSEDYLNNGQIFETEMYVNNIVIKSETIKRENEHEFDINENFNVF